MRRLEQQLKEIDGRGYKAYKQLSGSYIFERFQLHIDHVQGDPFALPSRISVHVPPEQHALPDELWHSRCRQTALEDFLGRAVAAAIQKHVKGSRGTGHSGEIHIATSGQQVLRRNAVLLDKTGLEARILLALPADGRSALGQEAVAMFFNELPQVVADGLRYLDRSLDQVYRHVEQVEDQSFLRHWLAEASAVAFVADGSILPRHSGIDDRPLKTGIPFLSPPSLSRRVELPNRGEITGMAIPRGITLIVGGGFHGKSTLLQALERGVYNHLPGDGRELVVTTPDAVKIRAEDHRSIHQVDISPFINNLPGNRSTTNFSTENASGSTSQAANIIEAMECHCDCLLIDEDTSATNFMIRDQRMQQLVSTEQEPITPLLHRIRELYEKQGISALIVTGGSGDYLSVADTVIHLDNYRPHDVSVRAREVAGSPPQPERTHPEWPTQPRPLEPDRLNANRPPKGIRINVREKFLLDFGRFRINLTQVEQLVDPGQTEAIGRLLSYCRQHHADLPEDLIKALQQSLREVEQKGLDILFPWKVGHLALPRLYELSAAANRIRL
ncbi:MAG TPA: ABC-ATPase domain-containing protein [Geopsychrobacteraceae bacterium]|nr:ABC-ATPase domain-containing protein [Geopsychrobacteraceae bacterium]